MLSCKYNACMDMAKPSEQSCLDNIMSDCYPVWHSTKDDE